MKRNFCIIENDEGKRRKLQQTITSMFQATGPEFVEAPGLQLVCPYCHHKFKAPQGLISHKYMHERAGHKIPPKKKIAFFKSPLASSVAQAAKGVEVSPIKVQRGSSQPKDQDEEESQKEVTPESTVVKVIATQKMTRRFTVSEKLSIIDKYHELKNTSSTCR